MQAVPAVDLGRVLLLTANDPPEPVLSPAQQRSNRRTVALLRAGVPLTLLMDLACPYGPASSELYAQELAG